MAEPNRKEKYEEKKSELISFRLTPSDVAALGGTGGPANASISEIARLRMLEGVAAFEERERATA